MRRVGYIFFGLSFLLATHGGSLGAATVESGAADRYKHAQQLEKDGNLADALGVYETLLLATDTPHPELSHSLRRATGCLRQLNRNAETDALRAKVVAMHSGEWRLLDAAAEDVSADPHFGFEIAGMFQRGNHRDGGTYMDCYERDRVQALQWVAQAEPLLQQASEVSAADLATHYLILAGLLTDQRTADMAWQLQILTDLSSLPPRDEGHWGHRRSASGAPVDANGHVVLYPTPASYEAARNDGERWRWALDRAATADPTVTLRGEMMYAQFLLEQFGVQTMAPLSHFLNRPYDDSTDNRQDRLSLPSLSDDETLARLATGVRRFELPPEHHFIARFQAIAEGGEPALAEQALQQLAQIFENRRQYERAAQMWAQSIEQYGPGDQRWKAQRLQQITGNWGQFEPGDVQPDPSEATMEYRFRNGHSLELVARRIDVAALLQDVRVHLKSDPKQLDWRKLQINDIGYRLVQEREELYVGDVAATWQEALDPAPAHFDRRVTLAAPLTEPGAYLVTATMAEGNTSHIILWISNTVLIKKPMADRTLLYMADATSGQPLPGLNIECFGYRRNHRRDKAGKSRTEIQTTHFAAFSNRDGMVLTDSRELGDAYQWMITATTDEAAVAPSPHRFAYLGFSRVWYSRDRPSRHDQAKAFIMTDRPVYRPGQPVHLKLWLQKASYNPDNEASLADQEIQLLIQYPQGTTLYDATHTTDAFGGVALDWTPPADARLGVYRIALPRYGSNTFRLEEYKKPEFEVTIDGPAHSVRLGDTIAFTIKGDYYFGAPVTKGNVRYKVERRAHDDTWYPEGPWDWLYGPGYGWLADDWPWLPGWRRWGCSRPSPLWLPRSPQPPELVAEGEAPLDERGQLTVRIDTAVAAELYGDVDQRYTVTADITDRSRRTVSGSGQATATRAPFRVSLWAQRGFYHVGDTIQIEGCARTPDSAVVPGQASIRLLRIRYSDATPTETAIRNWSLDTNAEDRFALQMEADQPGQYRLSCMFTDRQGNTVEGAQLITVRGDSSKDDAAAGGSFRFDTLQLAVERSTYAPGERAELLLGTAAPDQTVLLFVRPENGSYPLPRLLRMTTRTATETIDIGATDQPNIFVEALTVRDGQIRTVVRELLVPPSENVLIVETTPSATDYAPGEAAHVTVSVRDANDQPVVGPCVMTVYDKALDQIAGGGNVPDIRAFFWKWRRSHSVRQESNLDRRFRNIASPNAPTMGTLGLFGHSVADDDMAFDTPRMERRVKGGPVNTMAASAPIAMMGDSTSHSFAEEVDGGGGPPEAVEPAIRKTFADTAYWNGLLTTDSNGMAEVTFDMPENLTAWRIRTWALGQGARVGEDRDEVTTSKDLLLRLQAPRFFVEQDEVVLSANIHNYLATTKEVQAVLVLEGPTLQALPGVELTQSITIAAGAEGRVDWRVKVMREGEAVVQMQALTDEESDAMQMRFPVYVHGMLKTESFSRVIRAAEHSCQIDFTVPTQRRPEASRLEIRTSPSLAATLVDALPYLVHYPYGCTEQTLNRFLPTLAVQQTLRELGVDLETIKQQRALHRDRNEPSVPPGRQPERADHNPVFDSAEVDRLVREGIKRLVAMQVSDGGWGWFSGWGERSSPHTTAVVVQGLQKANRHGAAVPASVLKRGRDWLLNYEADQLKRLANADGHVDPWKGHADDMDALIFSVLAEAEVDDAAMRSALYRDRNHLSVYSKALLGVAMHHLGHSEERDMLLRNVEQYRVDDRENQTTYLELGNGAYWWRWYGQESEAHAAYLTLRTLVDPQSERTAGVAKYLLNNRRHGTTWDSTRDTAYCIEALTAYLLASGEKAADMTVTLTLDEEPRQSETITPATLFSRDEATVLSGSAVTGGSHRLQVEKTGNGPLYVNAALTIFSLEDMIQAAGLELKIDRQLYRLHEQPLMDHGPGAHGQSVGMQRQSYFREAITHATTLRSGDLVEIELTVTSKNDYEYIVIEDRKAGGMEPVALRSGYTHEGLRAYTEYRDERVVFFVQSLGRGSHSLSYRVRAEIPGIFSALPARAFGMYAPGLTANSNEVKIRIEDNHGKH